MIEHYNVHLDHYFLAVDANEMADTDAGTAGPGWVRSGYAFEGRCARGWILASRACEDTDSSRLACIGIENLPVPTAPLREFSANAMGPEFADRTGVASSKGDTFVVPGDRTAAAAEDVFLQDGFTMGIHVDTRSRGPAPLSSVTTLLKFPDAPDSGTGHPTLERTRCSATARSASTSAARCCSCCGGRPATDRRSPVPRTHFG